LQTSKENRLAKRFQGVSLAEFQKFIDAHRIVKDIQFVDLPSAAFACRVLFRENTARMNAVTDWA
jgi:hypothetical protein